jgi:hypothetical protein
MTFFIAIAAPNVWGKLFEKSFPQTPFKNFQQWKQGNARQCCQGDDAVDNKVVNSTLTTD